MTPYRLLSTCATALEWLTQVLAIIGVIFVIGVFSIQRWGLSHDVFNPFNFLGNGLILLIGTAPAILGFLIAKTVRKFSDKYIPRF